MVWLRNFMFQNGSECSKPIRDEFLVRLFFVLLGALGDLSFP